ncbi:glycosyltransferase [Croceibacterium xixiisoli]
MLAPADQAHYLTALDRQQIRTFPTAERSFGALAALMRAAGRLIEEWQPDIIHLHGTFAGLMIRLRRLMNARKRRVPLVYCSHGWSFNMQVSPWVRTGYGLIERVLASQADRIICISRFEYDTALRRGIPASRLRTIYNGIADIGDDSLAAAPHDDPDGPVRLLFMGRDCAQKGYDTLVAAMRLIPPAQAQLVSVGPEASSLDPASLQALGWVGRDDIPGHVARCDAVVVPSRWEGFGLVVIEAMRQSRAVIASTVDALPEIVADGVTGFLVPPDDVAALAARLSSLDRGTLSAMGARGRQVYVDRFTADMMNSQIISVYEELQTSSR